MPTNAELPITVVIVDDDATRILTRLLLQQDGRFEVLAEAADGVEGLAAVEAHQPDLLLLDVRLPRLDGFQVLAQLAGQRRPKVVAMSGQPFDDVERRVLDAGASAFLNKADLMTDLVTLLVAAAEDAEA